VERDRNDSGRVLTTYKKQDACTTAGARLIGQVGRRGGCNGAQRRTRSGGPEIDARMNSINEVQEMRGQTSALLCEDLGLKISDSLLILLSAQLRNAVQSGAVVSRQGRTYAPLRPRDGEVFHRKGSPQKRAMFAPRAPRAQSSAESVGARNPGHWISNVQLLRAVSRLQNATWPLRKVSGWSTQGLCIDVHSR
jgi:hypothetical protein